MVHAFALLLASIAFVPLDDRPVTAQLPVILGRIAGVRIITPPPEDLGHFLAPGNPDAVVRWLTRVAPNRENDAFVISTDMLAYGGLIASRSPSAAYADAYFRLGAFVHLRAVRPDAWIGAFGTVMRLAPTGVPASTRFFAAYPTWTYLQQYANLHDPPLRSEGETAQQLRDKIGQPTLDAYLATRARDLAVARHLLKLTVDGAIDRLVLGQDDAGPVGLHVREVGLLQSEAGAAGLSQRVSIEPGADELGMALVTDALARRARWTPRIGVRYSTPNGATFQDPLEFAPISAAVDGLIGLCGGVRDDERPDVVLFVRVPGTSAMQDDAFVAAMHDDISAGRSVALADLSFLESYSLQSSFAARILRSGLASQLDAYAGWNTNANTVGTALAEAIAAGAGRRMGTYGALAHRTFTFMRFLDDYAFHDDVRPSLNALLDAAGFPDHTLLPPAVASTVDERVRALLWNRAQSILSLLDPGYHIAAMTIQLPWARTFETRIDVGIAPNLP
jgi:hypothetical protein